MNWQDLIVSAVSASVGLVAGAWLRPYLSKKKPPAPKSAWDKIDEKIDSKE